MPTPTTSSPPPRFFTMLRGNLSHWQRHAQQLDPSTIQRLTHNRQNIQQAVETGLRWPQTRQETAVLAIELFDFIERNGYWYEWIPVLEQALTVDNILPQTRFWLLHRLGELYRFTRQFCAAKQSLQQAEAVACQLDDAELLAYAYYAWAVWHSEQRQYERSQQYIDRLLPIIDAWPTTHRLRLAVYRRHANLLYDIGDYQKAIAFYRQGLSGYQQIGYDVGKARVLIELATALQALGQLNEAEEIYLQALDLFLGLKNLHGQALTSMSLGVLYYWQEKWSQAISVLEQAQTQLAHKPIYLTDYTLVLHNLAEVYVKQNRLEKAGILLNQCVTTWQEIDDSRRLANSYGTLGHVFVAQGRRNEALDAYQRAITLLDEYPDDAFAVKLQKKLQKKYDDL